MSFKVGDEVTYKKETMTVHFVSGDEVTCVYTVDNIHHSIKLNAAELTLKTDQPLKKRRRRVSSY